MPGLPELPWLRSLRMTCPFTTPWAPKMQLNCCPIAFPVHFPPRNKSASWPSSRKRSRSQVTSFHLLHFDHPGREIPLFPVPGQPFLVPQPAQPGAWGGNCVLCGTPAGCSGTWRGCGASASSLQVSAWIAQDFAFSGDLVFHCCLQSCLWRHQ